MTAPCLLRASRRSHWSGARRLKPSSDCCSHPGGGFCIFALVAAVAAIALFRWLARRSARTLGMPDEEQPIATWNGGLRTRTMNATGGTARPELFDWGIRVRRPWRWLLPAWEAHYGELAKTELIKFPVANPGVLMRTSSSAVPLVFVSFRGAVTAVCAAPNGGVWCGRRQRRLMPIRSSWRAGATRASQLAASAGLSLRSRMSAGRMCAYVLPALQVNRPRGGWRTRVRVPSSGWISPPDWRVANRLH